MMRPGDSGDRTWAGRAAAAALAVAVVGHAGEARADRIVLRGGGQIQGKVLADPTKPNQVVVLTTRGKTPLTFRKEQVLSVIAEPGVLDDYLARRDDPRANTAEGQFNIGEWASEHKLLELAEIHFARALELDPAHAGAHERLGHVLIGERWLTRDELRQAQGLVKFKGKWITLEEKARAEESDVASTEQASWYRRIKSYRGALMGGDGQRRVEAEQKLLAIREPAAVTPLVRGFSEDPAILRALLARVLGGIPGPEAAAALVGRILDEGDPEVRQATMDELARRTEAIVINQLGRALGSQNTQVVNRAAWALGNLKASGAIPRLIAALQTVEYQVEMMGGDQGQPSSNGSPIFASGSSNGVANHPTGGFYGGGSIPILTGPTVGPGVVAYGATSAPLISPGPALPGPVVGFGTGTSTGRGPIPRLVPIVHQNVEVRAALVKLTGRDFGFDADSWRRFVSAGYRPESTPARRVPQP